MQGRRNNFSAYKKEVERTKKSNSLEAQQFQLKYSTWN